MLKKCLAALAAFYAAASFAAVDVNKATAAELDSVKGLGPAMSERIVQERQKGPFKDWEDFKTRVKGVGEKKAATLSEEGLTVGGASYGGKPAGAKAVQKAAGNKADAAATAKGKSNAQAQPAGTEKPGR